MRRAVPPVLDASQRSPPYMNAILSLYMSGKRSKRPSRASCAAVRPAQPRAQPATIRAETLRLENRRKPFGGIGAWDNEQVAAHCAEAEYTRCTATAACLQQCA